jgi:plastocyanin
MYMPPSSTSNSGSGSSGSGMTHTVWVAPTQGVLRYVPFAVNASVGDTVKFIWGANNHTVTKSSELTPCNKTSDQLFASGEQNKSFVCKNGIYFAVSTKINQLFSLSHSGC